MGNLLELLLEELKDIPRNFDVVHHTSVYALQGILKSGVILGMNYDDKATSNENTVEVAVLRRSIDKYIKSVEKKKKLEPTSGLEELTTNAEGVKIYISSDRIKASLRGAKKKPIAEFNKYFKKQFEKNLEEIYKERNKRYGFEKEDFEEYAFELAERVIKDYNLIASSSKRDFNVDYGKYIEDFKRKFMLSSSPFYIRFYIKQLITSAVRIKLPSTFGREGEERIILPKTKSNAGIPLSPLYMKIRIVKKIPLDKIIEGIRNSSKIGNDFFENVEKYDELFVKDVLFKEFKKDIKEAIEIVKKDVKNDVSVIDNGTPSIHSNNK
jgi:hypothetical protein